MKHPTVVLARDGHCVRKALLVNISSGFIIFLILEEYVTVIKNNNCKDIMLGIDFAFCKFLFIQHLKVRTCIKLLYLMLNLMLTS